MKKLGILVVLVTCILACNDPQRDESSSNIRMEILNRDFTDSEVLSIEIVEIEHPLLGGIIEITKLNISQQEKFLKDFNKLEKKGMYKCGVKYVVRLNFKTDTLRLSICGHKVSNRFSDFYYELPGELNIIEEYIK